MRYRKRSRLITPFRLFIVAILGVIGTTAWKSEWIPLQLGSAPTGALNETSSQEASKTGKNQLDPEYVEPVLEQETIIAQSEPPAEELTEGSDNQRSYQSRDIEIPRIYKRTLTGGIVEAAPKIDSPVHEAMEPKQFKGAAQPLVGTQIPGGSQPQAADRNAPQKLNPPEGIKRASAPVIKTAEHASYKEEVRQDPS
jgi:hypothetical protein